MRKEGWLKWLKEYSPELKIKVRETHSLKTEVREEEGKHLEKRLENRSDIKLRRKTSSKHYVLQAHVGFCH